VDDWAVARVGDGAAQDLVGERGGIAFAEEDEAHHVRDGIAFFPLEVDVGGVSGVFFEVDEKGGDGVGDDRALGAEDAVFADPLPFDAEGVLEIGGVGAFHLEEIDALVGGETVAVANEGVDLLELEGITLLGAVRIT